MHIQNKKGVVLGLESSVGLRVKVPRTRDQASEYDFLHSTCNSQSAPVNT